jgi:hypothetical protein
MIKNVIPTYFNIVKKTDLDFIVDMFNPVLGLVEILKMRIPF